ncbi:MAG: hypothetical protein Cons2KO_22510 [Congregibacter sp.]
MMKGLRTVFSARRGFGNGFGFGDSDSSRNDRDMRAQLATPKGIAGTLLAAIFLMLSACGGGGSGGSGGGFLPNNPNDDNTSYTLVLSLLDQNGDPTTLVTETFPATLQVLVREDNGNAAPVSGVVVAATADFAVISPDNGQALTNSEGIAELQVLAGATLGADTITVTVDSPAGQVTASIGLEISQVGLTLGHFSGTTFLAGQIGLSAAELAFRGTAQLRLAVVDDNGETVTAVQQIRLSSSCSLSGLARFRAVGDTSDGTTTLTIETVDGLATAEYLSGDCEDSDSLSAELVGTNSTASASVTIAGRDANFIGFVSSDPSEGQEGSDRTILALRGTGGPGRPEVATVTFEVLEESVVLGAGDPGPGEPGYLDLDARKPIAGVAVNFELSNTTGGIQLLNTTAVTDANGLARAEVRAGNVSSSTLVIASFDAGEPSGNSSPQSANSNQIVVSTGITDQNSISLEAEERYVPYAAEVDGVSVIITVTAADKFNNPVPDGTSAVFTTEYGDIDSSCLIGESNGARYQSRLGDAAPLRGTCRVLWVSQNPRFPTLNADSLETIEDDGDYICPGIIGVDGPCPNDMGAGRGLRSTVTVNIVGEEFFVDSNGNGIYDEGEAFENLPEAFIDHNEDGVYTPAVGPQCEPPASDEQCAAAGAEEEFVDLNGDGVYSLNVDPSTGEGVYNGSLCPVNGDGVFCSRSLINTRDSVVLTLASRARNLFAAVTNAQAPETRVGRFTEGETHRLYISDIYNNHPAAGTQGGSLVTLQAVGDCSFSAFSDTTATVVERNGEPGAFEMTVSVTGDPSDPPQGGQVRVSVQDPGVKPRDANFVTPSQPVAPQRPDPVEIARIPCTVFAPPPGP